MKKASKRKSSTQDFAKEYQKVMKGPSTEGNPPQWLNPGDFFVKFSLYKETPSIASTSTSMLQS